MPKIGFATPAMKGRWDAGVAFALYYVEHLSGDDVTDDSIAAAADLWGVDLSKFKTRHEKVLAIASAVACYYWERSDAAYIEYTLLPDDVAKDYWVKIREINSARDMEKLPAEMKAFLEKHGLEKPVHSSQLSAEDMKAYMADRGMELPVKAIQNVFTQIRTKLRELGMTWARVYIHDGRTKDLKAAQGQVAETNFMKGPIKCDLQPVTAWACEQLISLPDDIGLLAVALGHTTGLRGDEIRSPEYSVTKHSEFGIHISDLGKKRTSSSESESEDEGESNEIHGYDFALDPLQTGGGRYIVVCLATADRVIAALTKLRAMSNDVCKNTYYNRVRDALQTLEVLAPIRDLWHYDKGFTLHAMRSTYIEAVYHKLGALGLWPEGCLKAECTKKFLHHDGLDSSTAYGRMEHVASDEEPAASGGATYKRSAFAEEVVEPAAVEMAESAVAEVAVVDTVDIDHDIALAELNIALHKGIVAVTRSEIALLVLRKRKRDAI